MYISKLFPWLKSHCSRLTASLLPAVMHVPAPTRPLHMARCALCPNYPRVSIADMAMEVWIRCPNARAEFYSHVCRSCVKLEWREFARDYTEFVAARNYTCTAAACEVCATHHHSADQTSGPLDPGRHRGLHVEASALTTVTKHSMLRPRCRVISLEYVFQFCAHRLLLQAEIWRPFYVALTLMSSS